MITRTTQKWRVVRMARASGRVIGPVCVGGASECTKYLAEHLSDADALKLQRLYMWSDGKRSGRQWRDESVDPELRWFRVEGSVPAIQRIQARTAEEAIALACADRDAWDVDLDAPIEAALVECLPEDEDT